MYDVKIVYGSVEPIVTYRLSGDNIIAYGHAVHYDSEGNITKTTEPTKLSTLSWS